MQIKKAKDYYEYLYAKYPDVPKSDIRKILNIGWRNFYMLNSMGGDVYINNKIDKFFAYCGKLEIDPVKHFRRYIIKLCVKIRRRFIKSKADWDGYYYFGLTDKQYEHYTSQNKKRGRKKRIYNYGNQILYKLRDECSLRRYERKYLFRIYYGINFGFSMYKPDFTTDKAELIEIRKPLKFKDILITNNKFDI